MLAEVLWLVLGDHAMQSSCKKGKKAIVLLDDGVGKVPVAPGLKVFVVDVEGRELVCSHAMDLSNIVLVCCDSTRGRCAGGCRGLDEALNEVLEVLLD